MTFDADDKALLMRLIRSNEALAASVCELANSVVLLVDGDGGDEDEQSHQPVSGLDSGTWGGG